jgi:hypothetical protein
MPYIRRRRSTCAGSGGFGLASPLPSLQTTGRGFGASRPRYRDTAFYVGLEGGIAPEGSRRRPQNIRTAVTALGPAIRRNENDGAGKTGRRNDARCVAHMVRNALSPLFPSPSGLSRWPPETTGGTSSGRFQFNPVLSADCKFDACRLEPFADEVQIDRLPPLSTQLKSRTFSVTPIRVASFNFDQPSNARAALTCWDVSVIPASFSAACGSGRFR